MLLDILKGTVFGVVQKHLLERPTETEFLFAGDVFRLDMAVRVKARTSPQGLIDV